ncbi:MAG TPA: molybdopterin cofactor-binding domain-containing protein [Vicinamibacterales bacterium]|nr:molybdopterin cofactor-binding domain-containing protein [Vicinamibacterales bacterium]
MKRREFLKTSGALIVTFSLADASWLDAQGPFDTRNSGIDPRRLDSWIRIAADGRVTAYTGKCELGQGMMTAQMQLVAEELCVPLSRVSLVQCDTSTTPDQGTTSGSQSTPTNFNDRNLAQAAATAREALLHLASQTLGVHVDRLSAADGVVSVNGDASKKATYGDLVAGRQLTMTLSATAARKPMREWTVLGTPAMRVDMAAMATGTFEFVHNVKVPGMLHGRVVRPPSVGATLVSVDEGSVRSRPGFVKIVVKKNFVGVVCEKPWQAIQAARALKATWTPGPALPAHDTFYDFMKTQRSRDALVVNSRDTEQTLASAASVVKASYRYPYQMHGSMGSSCAVADVRGGKATVWSPTQSAYPTRNGVALLLGLKPEDVRVVFVRGAGCYGLNNADAVSFDAALMSQAVGRPVRVQLSRQDEMAWENYGFASVIEQRAGVDASGDVTAWECESWSVSKGGRPGYDEPGNVVSGALAGFATAVVEPRDAVEPTGELRNGSNAAPSYIAGRIAGKAGGAGTIRSERVVTHTIASPFFTGPLRSPSRLQNTFAHESFMDEIAAHVKADPVEYRLRHLSDPRLKEVVQAAAKAAKWDTRPSPASAARSGGARASGALSGRGMACVAYEGDNGYVAMIAEVDVDPATGRIHAKRFVVAQDCGPISNPDGIKNQIEGGALQGLSRALGEEVTWDDRQVTSIDWRTYHSLPLGFDVPAIETVLINRAGVRATGAGETAITVVAAAVGNAVFDATGVRLREAPFTPERVKAALTAASTSPTSRARG